MLEKTKKSGRKPDSRLIVWQFSDGKRGHDNQSDGLIRALADRVSLSACTIGTPPWPTMRAVWEAMVNYEVARFPSPDLIIGSGHGTHLALLAARRERGGRAVVLMNPSFLPRKWFDLCIIPEHDGVPSCHNTIITRGTLNRIRPSNDKDDGEGLLLIGGPTRHHGWSVEGLCDQITAIASRHHNVHWTVATSRRTPPDSLPALEALAGDNLDVVAFHEVDTEWLPNKLATCGVVWVTEDSVSMVYESLTAGAATGLLEIPSRAGDEGGATSRVALGLERLAAQSTVTPFRDWRRGTPLRAPDRPLDEAGRCAQWIVNHWVPTAD